MSAQRSWHLSFSYFLQLEVLSRQPLHKIMPNPDNVFSSMPAAVSLDVVL